MKAKGWSNPKTTDAIFRLLDEELDWKTARVADVGAGRGALSYRLAEFLRTKQLDPGEHVFPCDLIPASFEVETLECRQTGANGRLPFDDASFEATVSVEVIEHVEDQFAFLRELVRITKPGGLILVTTPNTLHMVSRVRSLATGFPTLFDPLPLAVHDPRRCGGHIHPISPYFLAYTALRSGMVEPRLVHDRRKTSASALALLTSPLWLAGGVLQRLRLSRKQPELLRENRPLLAQVSGWNLLTGRTAILCARRPGV
ncbi:MAG: class I SAM-dependent methyltransferase [Planctomycetes bacterium]|nr:class I SAM-dependent methyltransferase [Planctomycetota bacterium]